MRLTFTYDYNMYGGNDFNGRWLLRNWVHTKFKHTTMEETFGSIEYQRVMDEFIRKLTLKVYGFNNKYPFKSSIFKNQIDDSSDEMGMYDIKGSIWNGVMDCNGICDDLIKELDDKEWDGEEFKPTWGGYEFWGKKDWEESEKQTKSPYQLEQEKNVERKKRVEELEQQINSLNDKIRDTEVV